MSKSLRITLLFVIPAIALAAALLTAPSLLLKKRTADAIHAFGFTVDSDSLSQAKKEGSSFRDISLDKDGFSALGAVTVTNGLKGIRSIAFDRVTLTGELDGWGMPDITGWNIPRPFDPPRVLELAGLENGQLDLLTPEGAIRLTASAQMALAPGGGERKITAVIGGEQNQISLDTHWEAAQENADKPWNATGEIRNARIAFRKFSASRISGWLNLDGINATAFPRISGQISAGQVQIGRQSGLHNVQLTLDAGGKDGGDHLILQGDIAGYEAMRLTADISNFSGSPAIAATVETVSLPDLINFIGNLQEDLRETNIGSALLTSLLITPGNLARVEKEIKRLNYDNLELLITGNIYDLTGKIVAGKEKNGVLQRNVVSLDPG